MRKAIAVVLICLTLSAGAAFAGPAGARLSSPEKAVMKYINAERARRGLARVKAQSGLARAARSHSCSMAHRSYFSHSSADGTAFAGRLVAYGYSRSGYGRWSAGEDIYWGGAGTVLATARVAVARWMGSSAHRRVILKAGFRDVGVGVHSGGGRTYFTLDMGARVN